MRNPDERFKKRTSPVRGIIVHHTGVGLIARWKREVKVKPSRQPLDTAINLYRNVLPVSPHWVIDQNGEFAQVCDEAYAAHHTGTAGHQMYRKSVPAYWSNRWKPFGVNSPYDLLGGLLWATGSANNSTVGIEIVPNPKNATGPWSEECLTTLRHMAFAIAERHGFPCDALHVVGHYDAHPLKRQKDSGAPWDPWEVQFNPTLASALLVR